jgi:hypothetical protein
MSANPPFAAPLGGYLGASWFLMREERDPLHVRALVVERGDLRVALVSLDRVVVSEALREAVGERREFREAGVDALVLGATHTHTAPGGHVEAWPAEAFGLGAYDPLLLSYLADRVARAVASASAAMRPVLLERAEAELPVADGLSFNRRDPEALADPRLDLLRFSAPKILPLAKEGGTTTVASLCRFASHPTLIPFYLRRSSGDYPGTMCRLLEEDGRVALFAPGPCADLAAGASDDVGAVGWERRVERIGRRLAREAQSLEARGVAEADPGPLSHVKGYVRLPPREPWQLPFAGSAIASYYPERALIQGIRIGDVLIVTFGGEMSSGLGGRVRAAVEARTGAKQVIVWTLTDDYLGYAFSKEEHAKGGKSQHLTAYGPELGDLLLQRMTDLAALCWEEGTGTPAPSQEMK